GERGAARAAARQSESVVKLANPLTAIFHPPPTPGVLGVFGHLDATVDAIGQLRRAGHTDFTVYSPIPRHEIEDALEQPVSPVRMFTLIGGIAGCAIAALVALAAIGCNPDDVVHRIGWFATMRHQRSIKPYAQPIPPVPGTVPVTGADPLMSLQTADRLVNPRTRTSESINRGRFLYE